VTTSGDRAAQVWDAATGDRLRRLNGHRRGVQDAGFSRDGEYIVTGADDGMIGVWNACTGARLALLQMPSASVTSVQFSPASQVILTVGEDRVSRIYNCEICAPVDELRRLAEQRQHYVTGRTSTL
jgi:WD40 repeat protein